MIPSCYRVLFFLGIILVKNCACVQLSSTVLQVSDGNLIDISLSTYNKSLNEDQAFTKLITINKSINFVINAGDIPKEVSFIIMQVHTFMYNATMSYDKPSLKKVAGRFITGSNIGLFVETKNIKNAIVYVSNENTVEVSALVAVVAYRSDAPYPGGCNMEFEIEKSPFQKLVYDSATVTVDAQPAAAPKKGNAEPPCERDPLEHDAYRMFMPEQDFSNDTYFAAIASMLTVRDIERNADFVPASLFGSTMRRVYSLYSGTGSVYGMVAHSDNRSSAYVPIVTYGCDPTSWSSSCSILTSTFPKVLCALTFFLGLLISTRGQYYFKISMFLIGLLFGGYIGYTIGVYLGTFDVTGNILTGMFLGTMISLLWLLLWLTLSSPIPSLVVSSLTLGSFFFFIFYYAMPAGIIYLEIEAYFWLLFSTFVIMVILIFTAIPLIGNILCFTILGAYATVLSIDYYSGASLKYIVINGMRRITADNFKVAVVQPPYQDKDVLLTVFWAFLVIVGLYKQCADNRNRAPFPPSTTQLGYDERTPLLGVRRN